MCHNTHTYLLLNEIVKKRTFPHVLTTLATEKSHHNGFYKIRQHVSIHWTGPPDWMTGLDYILDSYKFSSKFIIGGCRLPHYMVYIDHATLMLLMINAPSLVSGNETTLYNTTHTKLFSASGSAYFT